VDAVLAAPVSTTRSTDGLSVAEAFAQSTGALASGGESTQFTVLLDRIADPVDLGVTADGVVVWVDADDFEVFVGGILGDPVGVEDAESAHAATDTFLEELEIRKQFGSHREPSSHLSNRLQLSVRLQLVDSMALGLAIGATLVHWTFAASTTNADAVDEESLLCTVSQTTCLVGA
jgi:hypothetical protein